MARLLLLKACHKIDTQGVPASVDMIAATKTTIPFLVQKVIDRCMQIHGAGGLTEDYMMAEATTTRAGVVRRMVQIRCTRWLSESRLLTDFRAEGWVPRRRYMDFATQFSLKAILTICFFTNSVTSASLNALIGIVMTGRAETG